MSARQAALLLAAGLAAVGCTSLKPVDLPAAALHSEILAGNLVRPGDRIRVRTQDGEQVSLRVVEVREGTIVGKGTQVPVASITQLESRDFSAAKTAALAGGISGTVLIGMLVALSSMAFMM
ncbi:MAG: hypothetical protein R3E86_15870 [Pseudomonadales bacterium]